MEQLISIYDIVEGKDLTFENVKVCARTLNVSSCVVKRLLRGRLENIGSRYILSDKKDILTKIIREGDGAIFLILNARSLGLILGEKDSSKDRQALCLIKNDRAFSSTIMGQIFSKLNSDKEKIKQYLNKQYSKRDREKDARYRNSCKERLRQNKKDWIKENKDHVKSYSRLYTANRRKNDPSFRIRMNLRSRLKMALMGETKKGSIMSLIGCDKEFLVSHIQSQFSSEMCWENYGTFWNIDHIIPCSFFDLAIEDHQRMCCFYKNLRPLTLEENGFKLNKLPNDYRSFISDNLIEAALYPVTAYKLMLAGHVNL